MRKTRPAAERFWEKVNKTDTCWLWTAKTTRGGYGNFYYGSRADGGNRHAAAHRWAYEDLVGPIPDGLQLDHLCRTPACVNPAHLEPVTGRVNTLRSTSPSALNAVKTHCSRGHEFTPENTFVRQGKRRCRTCTNAHQRSADDRARARATRDEVAALLAPPVTPEAYQAVIERVLAVSDELAVRLLDDGGSEYADGIHVAARLLRAALTAPLDGGHA